MSFPVPISRRKFIVLAAGACIAVSGCSNSKPEAETGTAIELLDRQHGVLCRAISILEEIRGGMDARMDLPPEIIQGTIETMRRIIVDYHQKLEEKYIYTAFDSAKKMGGLIGILREQHDAGSQLTGVLGQLAAGFSVKDLERRRTLGSAIHQFSRMYRAHADREDTLLFPVLRQVVSPAVYEEMSGAIRKDEALFLGSNGFDEAIQKLASYEEILGIGDLAAFTPQVEDLR